MTEDQREAFDERAAIIEFCSGSGMTRREAECLAAEQMGLSNADIQHLRSANGSTG